MFFINGKEKEKLYEYIRKNFPECQIEKIGKAVQYGKPGPIDSRGYITFPHYQQVRINIKKEDFTALKLMFDIKQSLFR